MPKEISEASTSRNPYINGDRTWVSSEDGPLCVKCGEVGFTSNQPHHCTPLPRQGALSRWNANSTCRTSSPKLVESWSRVNEYFKLAVSYLPLVELSLAKLCLFLSSFQPWSLLENLSCLLHNLQCQASHAHRTCISRVRGFFASFKSLYYEIWSHTQKSYLISVSLPLLGQLIRPDMSDGVQLSKHWTWSHR